MTNVTAPAQGTPSELTPGSKLGDRFEVGSKYDSDGFGRLYGGTDTKTTRSISLRQIRKHLATPEVIRALRAEVKASGHVKHASLHGVFGLATAPDGSPVLVQAPVGGRNLADHVRTHRESGSPITVRGAYNVVAHVAQALEALSSVGAHGALRPSAVWITSSGSISLMDFAVARAVLSCIDASKLPEADTAYLAPEVKAGGPATPQSDVFGLGALLYVLVTGRSPNEEFIAPSQAHEEADERIDQELLKALSADPATRHASPREFREALLPLMSGLIEANADDFGVDIDIDVSLASIRPSMRPGSSSGATAVRAPAPAPVPTIVGDPLAGMRVSAHEGFRASQVAPSNEQEAAEQRKSIGAVDLQDVLTKITENDDARWMLVKDGMDHGPFTGKQLVNQIVKGEALADHGLLNMDTGERRKVKEFTEFTEFLEQYKLRQKEEHQKVALAHAETKERRSTLFKVGVGAAIVAALGLAGGTYLLTRGASEGANVAGEELGDLYERGEIEISGSAGILPPPKRGSGKGRRSGGGGGGGGGAMSYEQAMMQAVDIGSASGGGERQLTAGTVAGVMNRHLNGIYNACVKGSVGKVRIDLAILGSGQVQGVSVRAGDAGFQRCVAGKVRQIRFPKFPAPRMGARYSFDT